MQNLGCGKKPGKLVQIRRTLAAMLEVVSNGSFFVVEGETAEKIVRSIWRRGLANVTNADVDRLVARYGRAWS